MTTLGAMLLYCVTTFNLAASHKIEREQCFSQAFFCDGKWSGDMTKMQCLLKKEQIK